MVRIASWFLCLGTVLGQEPSLHERLAGAWEQAEGGQVLHFDGDRCVLVEDGRQVLFAVEYGEAGIRRRPLDADVVLDETVAFTEGGLTLTYPGGRQVGYRRLAAVPDDARREPLPLGTRNPEGPEIARLGAELRERAVREQAVREELAPLLHAGEGKRDRDAEREVMRRMHAIDVDNTRRLVAIVTDVGWIDRARFSERACADAFLIVQHSGSLRLMQAVLPLLEAEARQRADVGEEFALLFDRTQLALGREQRYGTQLREGEGGVMHVVRLLDPDGVDERRRSVGLPPLEDYLQLFRRRGAKVVVDR